MLDTWCSDQHRLHFVTCDLIINFLNIDRLLGGLTFAHLDAFTLVEFFALIDFGDHLMLNLWDLVGSLGTGVITCSYCKRFLLDSFLLSQIDFVFVL